MNVIKPWLVCLRVIRGNPAERRVECSAGDLDEALIRPNPCSRQTLEHFVYDFFLARIGNRMLAEAHLTALFASVARLRAESRKIDMFGRLLGIFDAIPQVRYPPCTSSVGFRQIMDT